MFNGYFCFTVNAKRLNVKGRASGGIALYVKQDIKHYVTRIFEKFSMAIFLRVKGELFNISGNVIIVNAYIPPEGSVFYEDKDDNGIDILKSKMHEITSMYPDDLWCMMGDYNARTGNRQDYINDGFGNVPGMDWYVGDDFSTERKSKDQVVNKFGVSLIEMCIEFNIHIVNGRVDGDEFGDFTFINRNGCSVIDYFMMSTRLFASIYSLTVSVIETGSHFPIICNMKGKESNRSDAENVNRKTCMLESFYTCKWNEVNRAIFVENVNQDQITILLENIVIMCKNGENVNTITDVFNETLYEAGKHMIHKSGGQLKNTSGCKKKSQPAWWNECCFKYKRERDRALYVLRRNHNEENLGKYLVARDTFKHCINERKNQYLNKLKKELEEHLDDPKGFWKCIKNLGRKEQKSSGISPNEWFSHFKNLLSQESTADKGFQEFVNKKLEANDNERDMHIDVDAAESYVLNREIGIEEVIKTVKALPDGKSPGEEGMIYEVFKAGLTELGVCIVHIFNRIMHSGEFPESWAKGLLCTLHKKGSTRDPNNYRGISLLPCLSKIFCKLLNNRLVKFAELMDLQHEEQAAYRKGYSTIDQIFVLQSLVQKQTCQKNGRYYMIFIDFQKAFDSVPHNLLLYTLLKHGIHGRIFTVIKSLYSKLKSSIRVKEGVTECFDCTIGTRQGCMLSPFMFTLYMNELIEMLQCFDCKGTYVCEEAKNIMILMYADDVAEGANAVKKLQDMIDVLNEFCLKWGLRVNMDKTRIVVFRRGGKIKKNEKWQLNGADIVVVPMYKYLGIVFTCQLNWGKAVYTLSMQARKAIGMINSYSIKCGGLPVKIAFQLFDKMVVPIMLYGSEVWGYKYYKVIEDVQTYFCKILLGLPKQTSNNAVMGDCGRFLLAEKYHKRCLKYWFKILEMPNSRYVKSCYKMIKNLDDRGKTTWASSVKELLFKYGFGIVWMEQGVGNVDLFLHRFNERVRDCYIQEWYNNIHDSSKLSVYCTFKSLLEPEKYLNCIKVWKHRQSLAKLRCSCHKLEIEAGRHNKVLMEHRVCKYCDKQNFTVIEDEFHFLLCCPLYENLRKRVFGKHYIQKPSFSSFISIMSTNDEDLIAKVAVYIFQANKIRDKEFN